MTKLIEEQRKSIMLFIRDFVYKMRDSGVDFEEPRRVELEQWAKQIPNKALTQFIDSALEIHEHNMKIGEDYQYSYGDIIDFLSNTKKNLYEKSRLPTMPITRRLEW